jgi:hypothetical protein
MVSATAEGQRPGSSMTAADLEESGADEPAATGSATADGRRPDLRDGGRDPRWRMWTGAAQMSPQAGGRWREGRDGSREETMVA